MIGYFSIGQWAHIRFLFLGLGLALAYVASALILYVADPVSKPVTGDAVSVQTPVKQVADRSTILERNILDIELPKPPVSKTDQSASPGLDPANWNIIGTFVGSRSMVIVVAQDKTEYLLEGESLHGWELYQVTSESVIWSKDGEMRTVASKAIPAIEFGKGHVRMEEGKSAKVSLEKEKAQAILSQPGALLQQALFKPNMYFGKIKGFTVTNIQPRSILEDMGLEDGDVLVRINGVLIDGPQTLMQLYTSFSRTKSLSIDVERQGVVHSLMVEMQ